MVSREGSDALEILRGRHQQVHKPPQSAPSGFSWNSARAADTVRTATIAGRQMIASQEPKDAGFRLGGSRSLQKSCSTSRLQHVQNLPQVIFRPDTVGPRTAFGRSQQLPRRLRRSVGGRLHYQLRPSAVQGSMPSLTLWQGLPKNIQESCIYTRGG